ncbi:MAG TPA: ABC transporter permease [Blastocatellia bacterium]
MAWHLLYLSITRASLQEGPRAGTSGNRLRSCLVVAEIALSLVLLAGAGLLLRSFLKLESIKPGFNPGHLLTFQISPAGAGYQEDSRLVSFYTALLERLAAIPGVQAAGAVNTLPLDKGPYYGYFIEKDPPYTVETQRAANFRTVSAGYFRVMGVPLLSGRTFTSADTADAPGVVIINRSLAQRDFPDVDPVGQRLGFGSSNGKINWRRIVGVVDDFKNDGLASSTMPEAYRPYVQVPFTTMSFVIRAVGEPTVLANAIRAEAYDLDKNQPASHIATMDQLLADTIAGPRFNMVLLASFAAVALIMAASGIYAVMSYAVTVRTHEIGVRLALGAKTMDVLRLVLGKAMVLAFAGIVIGIAGTYGLSRLMSSLLFGVAPTDRPTLFVVSIGLAAVALVAAYIPARRALGVDAMTALRQE